MGSEVPVREVAENQPPWNPLRSLSCAASPFFWLPNLNFQHCLFGTAHAQRMESKCYVTYKLKLYRWPLMPLVPSGTVILEMVQGYLRTSENPPGIWPAHQQPQVTDLFHGLTIFFVVRGKS